MTDSLDFVAIDFETANGKRSSVCQVGLATVVDGVIRSSDSWLVIPPTGLDSFHPTNTRIHGIDAAQIAKGGALDWSESLAKILRFSAGKPLVAHNSAFDESVFRGATEASGIPVPTMEWHDSLRLSKRHIEGLGDYKLPTIAKHLDICFTGHHDAENDAVAAAEIIIAIAKLSGLKTMGELFPRAGTRTPGVKRTSESGPKGGNAFSGDRGYTAKVADLPVADKRADPENPLYGHSVVLTGDLGVLLRWQAFEAMASMGATPQQNVTKKTTLLVVANAKGTMDPILTGTSSKERKALEYRAKGQAIRAISGETFLGWLECKRDKNAKPIQVEPSHSKRPSRPARSPRSVQVRQTAQPSRPAEPVQPSTPAKPAQPSRPTRAGQPVQPSTPATSANPSIPAKPAQSSRPTQPFTTAKPAMPIQKHESVAPTNPVGPAETRRHIYGGFPEGPKRESALSTGSLDDAGRPSGATPARALGAQVGVRAERSPRIEPFVPEVIPVRARRVLFARTGAGIGVAMMAVSALFLVVSWIVFPQMIAEANGVPSKIWTGIFGLVFWHVICGVFGLLGVLLFLRRKKLTKK